MTPSHFSSYNHFTKYIYMLAIRDLTALIRAQTPSFGEPDEATKKNIEENRAELRAIRARLKRISK